MKVNLGPREYIKIKERIYLVADWVMVQHGASTRIAFMPMSQARSGAKKISAYDITN